MYSDVVNSLITASAWTVDTLCWVFFLDAMQVGVQRYMVCSDSALDERQNIAVWCAQCSSLIAQSCQPWAIDICTIMGNLYLSWPIMSYNPWDLEYRRFVEHPYNFNIANKTIKNARLTDNFEFNWLPSACAILLLPDYCHVHKFITKHSAQV